jgi:hypothetical protein
LTWSHLEELAKCRRGVDFSLSGIVFPHCNQGAA